MFSSLTANTKSIISLLAISCIVIIYYLKSLFITDASIFQAILNAKTISTIFVLISNLLLMIFVLKKHINGLFYTLWFSLIQILTFETQALSLRLNFGYVTGLVLEFEWGKLTINVIALFIFTFAFLALKEQKELSL